MTVTLYSRTFKNEYWQDSTFQKGTLGCHIDYYCNEFQFELMAVGHNAIIYVDNQATLNALIGHLLKSKLVSDCKASLRSLSDTYNISLCCVPGHCDIEGNEVDDKLARQGSTYYSIPLELSVKPPISNVFMTKRKLRPLELGLIAVTIGLLGPYG